MSPGITIGISMTHEQWNKEILSRMQDADLTPREQEIMWFLLQGKMNKEIAIHFDLELNTIKEHLRAAYRKLSVNSRSQAILTLLGYQSFNEGMPAT